jgi:predicted ATPase
VLQRFIAPQTAQRAIRQGLDEIYRLLEESQEQHEDDEDLLEETAPMARWDRDEFIKLFSARLLHAKDVEGDSDLVLMDMNSSTTVSHRDVGIGISQVLPVLVEAYGNEGRLVAIEQPEIHLHPQLQAELSDVFLESALGPRRNTFLLETHSEHIILRVMRRIRETTEGRLPAGMVPVRPEDVVVLSVVPDKRGAQIVEIPITKDGELGGPWPGGFFPERMRELY